MSIKRHKVHVLEAKMWRDQSSFLERWFRQVLNAVTSQSTFVIDGAYHIRAMRDNKVPQRTLIMQSMHIDAKQL